MGDPTLVKTVGRWECLQRDKPDTMGTRYAVTRQKNGEIEHVVEYVDQNPQAVMVTATPRSMTSQGLTVLTIPLDVIAFVHGS
jgi:hypothetical protein